MKLTKRGHYSVKALLDLSLQANGSLASVNAIAQRQSLPAPYLEKLLIELRRANLVVSVRGAQGGLSLGPSRLRDLSRRNFGRCGRNDSPLTALRPRLRAGRRLGHVWHLETPARKK